MWTQQSNNLTPILRIPAEQQMGAQRTDLFPAGIP
jgi:hypothetical protein